MRRKKWMIVCLIAFAVVFIIYLYVDAQIRPIVFRLAEAHTRQIAAQAMNQAILECLDDAVTYDRLVHVVYDTEGRITMLQANVVMMNRLAANAAQKAQDALAGIDAQGVSIPLGNVIGAQILSGIGPMIHVSVMPVGTVQSEFTSSLQSAGINQTRHLIQLRLKSVIQIVLPSGGQSIEVTAEAPVAESVIVGQVPEYFAQFQNTDPGALNLVPRTY